MPNCNKCGVETPAREYKCRDCRIAYQRAWYAVPENRAKRVAAIRAMPVEVKRNYHLKRFYGITLDEYNALFEAQGGLCAGCNSAGSEGKRKGLFVDHDHETGAIRGLLCNNCNAALGLLGDKAETIARLMEYLRPKGESLKVA